MPGRCVVGGCSSFPDVKNGLILHAIPFLNDERPEARKRRNKWVQFVKQKRAKRVPTPNSSVFSRHFTENDYVRRFSFVDEITKKPIMPRLKRDEIGINVVPSVHAEAVTKKTVISESAKRRRERATLKNAKRRMEALTATLTASSSCKSDFAEIEPEGNGLQSLAVLAENSSQSLNGNNTDSVDELHELVQDKFKQIAGGEYTGFSNSTFLSERETADKNYALGYYMNAHKAFPPNTNLMDTFELYFHTCSTETNCDAGSVMAATLANGGICPLTGQKVFSSQTVQHTLSLMLSCGLYDYSGQFAFHVGLPAKSGVSGAILIVVPKVCGVMVWSPPLDDLGNSVRGMQFCKELVSLFNFHNYDLKGASSGRKLDPRRRKAEVQGEKVVYLLYAASSGDVTALRRYYLSGTDMTMQNYDGRTALHVAAAQGHHEVIKFLLERCEVPVDPKDRWGFSPLDEAVRFGHQACVDFIKHYLQ